MVRPHLRRIELDVRQRSPHRENMSHSKPTILLLTFLVACATEPALGTQQAALGEHILGAATNYTLGSGDNNNLDQTYYGTVLNLTPDASGSTLTGLEAYGLNDGWAVLIRNVHATRTLTIADEHASSTSTNRFALSSPIVLRGRESVWAVYDNTSWRWYVVQDQSVRYVTPSTPSRTTASAFQPSTHRPVAVSYSVRIAAAITLTTGAAGRFELKSDASNPPTTVRARVAGGVTGTLVIGASLSTLAEAPLTYIVPAGHYVQIDTVTEAGTPTYTITTQVETTL